MKKRVQKKVVFRGVGRPKREWDFGPPVARSPLRQIERLLPELSDNGVKAALNLKFGPERTSGSAESLRIRPREPGHGAACRLPYPELMRRIADLQKYVGVKQYEVL